MRKEFLRSVAERLYKLTDGNLKDYCLVFPNRRSSLFFRRYLGECTDKPVFSPCITTVNDMFARMSGLKTLDKITLLYRLYNVYCSVVGNVEEPFDDFIYRGEVMLNDFDDIDKYMADARGLFTNIRDLKEIEDRYDYLSPRQREAVASFWGVVIPVRDGEKESRFLRMWDNMYGIYSGLRELLATKGEAYEGMVYRAVAEGLREEDPDLLAYLRKYEAVVFVGLNAPNRCERQLFDSLISLGKGDFYWDYYGEAVTDPANKSSMFMSGNVRRYPSLHPLPEDGGLPDSLPKITAISVPSAVGQTKYVHRILKEIVAESGETDLFSTAILLPDEQLLFPLLNSLPEEVSPVNVTMGYSLAHCNVSSFISAIASLQERARMRKDGMRFYYRDVLNVLRHPYVDSMDREKVRGLRERITGEAMIYVPVTEFSDMPGLCGIFRIPEPDGLPDYLKHVLDTVFPYTDQVDRHFFDGYAKCINQLRSLGIGMRTDTFFRLLRRVESSVSIPFSGEPLDGLQIMGPLEIRSLDFENLIILSVNEGTFPSRSTASSMIPYNLRRGFGLPTYEFQDSISAYHFYRSLCRAGKVWLLYDARSGGLNSGEESRYIKQLEYHYAWSVERRTVSFGIVPGKLNEVPPVPKTAEHLERLRSMTFSSTSFQTWLTCPMRFYYRYILGLPEERDIAEGLDNAAFGTLYHYVMGNLYRSRLGKVLEKRDLLEMAQDKRLLNSLVEKGFTEELRISEVQGRNRIAWALVENIAAQTLRVDARIAPFTVLKVEEAVVSPFTTDSGNTVRIKGVVDRMDVVEGMSRIVDYKTGGNHFACQDIEELFDPELYDKGKHLFQLFLYLLILKEAGTVSEDHLEDVLLEIYYTRNLYNTEGRIFRIPQKNEFEAFCRELSALVDSILSPEVPFTVCESTDACSYCPYISKCNR